LAAGGENSSGMQDLIPSDPPPARLRLRLLFGEDAMLGPGKADLLERIRKTGSISAAGRGMDMSYKRAWMLVEEMNAAFREPLVDSARGGPGGGGARLTATGEQVLALYREIEALAAAAAAGRIERLGSMLRDMSKQK
jgi:molybdate transport system regulatory protein